MIQRILIGVLIIGFLIAEPDGLAALSQRVTVRRSHVRKFAGVALNSNPATGVLS